MNMFKPIILSALIALALLISPGHAHDFGQHETDAATDGPRTATVVHADDPRKKIGGGQDQFDLLVSGAETDGQYFLMEAVITPGGRAPEHVQTREEEGFYILSGTLNFYADGQQVIARAGTFINIPKGVPHYFENVSGEDAKMLILLSPSGLEHWFEAAGEDPANARALGEAEYGLEFIQDFPAQD
ncbi:cupin domain-containing protein [Litoreibacter roseus]|uniref:Cupin type-2 domain-containing protein n=1 Tax=Litoreibacter roseus TaxID=2601869 RepID=A0A6N6JL89_9RHOB|nr:cupin domain-containing protein [Litoreibacter roseus]GFE67073.1 hypothetical protein KIN_41470 [Litoreibacter roseus]